jgi:geranylgeranyl pyrophosphate synthase
MSEPIACVIELIHTATLVHDDVVDDSNRRSFFLYQCTGK